MPSSSRPTSAVFARPPHRHQAAGGGALGAVRQPRGEAVGAVLEHLRDRRAGQHLDPLAAQGLAHGLADPALLVGQDRRQRLHQRHAAAEGRQHRGELAADDAAADDDHALGQLVHLECRGGGERPPAAPGRCPGRGAPAPSPWRSRSSAPTAPARRRAVSTATRSGAVSQPSPRTTVTPRCAHASSTPPRIFAAMPMARSRIAGQSTPTSPSAMPQSDGLAQPRRPAPTRRAAPWSGCSRG